MRPTYESSQDLRNEQDIILTFTNYFGGHLTPVKMPKQYRLDYCLVYGDVIKAFAEVKKRKNPKDKYETYIISLSKVMTAKSIKRDTGLDALIIVEWEDCIGYTQLDGDWIIKTGGRVDRNDWQDIEPVVHIPVTEFTILEIK
mgnify:CR=1 FL=1|jgi:hypothetical protein|tara:strand:+ start:2953 stop:3381 length:429 start_codon:yes stop_codon:yes gene_type:complete